jgi:putative addiction module component (TIGR02574 family)
LGWFVPVIECCDSEEYDSRMKPDSTELLKVALKLPPEARAALASSLIDSLDQEVDEGAEAAWEVEIERRIAELDSGKARPVPWADARRRIAGR